MSEIQGTVEEIIFKNEQNGYVVAKIKQENELITVVGCIPYMNEGQNLKMDGDWVVHPHFGRQFKVKNCTEIRPDSIIGIEKYLASGIISGIGPVTAKKIVEKFKEKTLEILDNDIGRLSEIEGIGQKKINTISESYSKQAEIKNIMVSLQTYGVTANQCVKIYKKYGKDSIETVQKNPYILAENIAGIGFKTADKIAKSMGIALDSQYRIQSGIMYVINKFCNTGNTYMPFDTLIKETKNVLNVKEDKVEEGIYECALEQKIKVEIIEDKKCVFSIPYYYCEVGVTKKILTLAFSKFDDLKIDVQKEIKEFESKNCIKFGDEQKEAIEGAFENGIEVITGGPGTGKTTIINCIADLFEKLHMTVFMTAPTGRAAKRMTEATGREAKTIHRLLELGFDEGEDMIFFKNEKEPLECDVLIVDEASMIDIVLMNNLMKAVSIGTRVIIVGDADQLPSVGPGNVLKDIIDSECIKVVKLNHIFRQAEKSLIVVNAHRINRGEMPLVNEKDKDFYFINCTDTAKILDTIINLVNVRLPRFNKNWNKIEDIQVLTPTRKGILGVENLNKHLQEVLNPKIDGEAEKEFKDFVFRAHDKVMQIKNDYSLKWARVAGSGENEGLGIFNGDVGFIENVDDENGIVSVIFDGERRVKYDNSSIDELELAYAVTIHKSQGSEFPVIVMPSFMGPPLLMNRNLLYTGITRAKKLVVMVGFAKSMQYMVLNNKTYERFSSLNWRMKNLVDYDVQN